MSRRRGVAAARRAALFIAGVGIALGLLPSVASAADKFTIDSNPASFAPVVTDSAGDGYVTWEHSRVSGIGPDQPMFCKLTPGTNRCKHPVALSLPGGGNDQNNADEVFPILGPGSTVWVVSARYVDGDVLVWTSSNGGASFGGAYDIPYTPNCTTPGCTLSYPYADNTDADDSLPVANDYSTYAGQVYKTTSGHPAVSFLTSSYNPGLGFTLNNTAETSGGPQGGSEFQFGSVGGGGVGGSALGTTSTGDVVEAYWLDTTPPTLRYYSFKFTPASPHPISPQVGWKGPTTVGYGYLPRLADGADGLFMLSSDLIRGATPTAVDLRRYNKTTRSFGSPKRITKTPAANALFLGGGLTENQDTGEMAVAWPTMTDDDQMHLYLSTDGGERLSPAQDIATIDGTNDDFDDVRVAISKAGTGWVTWEDDGGLEVANLYPLASQYGKLRAHRDTLEVPVTCPAPRHSCRVTVTVSKPDYGRLGRLTASVPAGATRTLKVVLSTTAIGLLSAHHRRISATVAVVVQPHGASANTTTVNASIGG